MAIQLAGRDSAAGAAVFVCDEPEAGLHRLAERHLATGLPKMASRGQLAVLVATHSPVLLSGGHTQPVLVTRGTRGAVDIRPLAMSLLDGLSAERTAGDLGLAVGDLLVLMSVVVVVEGLHDETVFSTLIRDDLDASLATLLPTHGAKRLQSLAEARLLVDGTDAVILIVLDDLDQQVVQPLWDAIAAAYDLGDLGAVRDGVRELRDVDGDTYVYLSKFAERAAELGRLDRVRVFGMSEPDVICYLDPDDLLLEPGHTWAALKEQWAADALPGKPSNIKKWLAGRGLLPKQPEDVDAAIAGAARAMQRRGAAVAADLVGLGARIRELGLRE
jgi:hypothetical protein